jgi:hypothetical protein
MYPWRPGFTPRDAAGRRDLRTHNWVATKHPLRLLVVSPLLRVAETGQITVEQVGLAAAMPLGVSNSRD